MTFDEIENTLPWGLHDAYLEGLTIDWLARRLEMRVRVMMSERQDMDQRARLTVTELLYCAVDPPQNDENYEAMPAGGLWLDTGKGAAKKGNTARLPETPPDYFVQWFFVQRWNSFIHVCGKDVSFEWLETEPVPSRDDTRALFPGESVEDPPT